MGAKSKYRGLVAADIDGLVAQKTGTRRYDFENFVPVDEVIHKINRLYRRGYVIIYYTARPVEYYKETFDWLIQHNCEFHALRMGKMRADYYLDDHNENIDNLLEKER